MEMEIKDIVKKYESAVLLALEAAMEASFHYEKGDVQAAKEELLLALDKTIEAKQHLDNYIKKLQEYQKDLEASKGSIVELIETRYFDKGTLEKIKKKYQELYKKI